jgi:hypothetical protein
MLFMDGTDGSEATAIWVIALLAFTILLIRAGHTHLRTSGYSKDQATSRINILLRSDLGSTGRSIVYRSRVLRALPPLRELEVFLLGEPSPSGPLGLLRRKWHDLPTALQHRIRFLTRTMSAGHAQRYEPVY